MMRILTVLVAGLAYASAAVAQDETEGEALYMQFCATCHGIEAEGNGPMAPTLLVPPSNLRTLVERYEGFPVLRVVTRIDGRDPLVSHGSDMPVYGWFFEGTVASVKTDAGQPIVTTQPIVDLLAYLRTLQD